MVKNQAPKVDVLLEIPLDIYKEARRCADKEDGDDSDLHVNADDNQAV